MNKKEVISHIAESTPSIIKNLINYAKDNFDKNGQDSLENVGGTIGTITKLLAKPFIDKYFQSITKKKHDNFGTETYFKSAIKQGIFSLESINFNPENSFEIGSSSLTELAEKEGAHFTSKDILLIFQPKYHPSITFIRNYFARILDKIGASQNQIDLFLKDYNENIENRIISEFGKDYTKHISETEHFRLKENETYLLWNTIQNGKIGFKKDEDLKYEPTYGYWKKVADLREKEYNGDDTKQIKTKEKSLKKLEVLIDEYFKKKSSNHLNKILFIVADFGKGKSVFLKHYAATLAKKYLNTSQGHFPIYFNLRNYNKYSSEQKLGVIGDFLETEYSIKVDDDYFKQKKYVFLIDSLDESGELSKRAIDKVIHSVKEIQNIDKTKYKTNRIIITSRPFDEGLTTQLKEHDPHIIKNKEERDVPYYISAYGFTKDQFNNWLCTTLKNTKNINSIKGTGFAKEIIEHIKNDASIDIYQKLLENKTLSASELRRPIFAYMIYQLIINNVDFLSVGKIGVYLSFLNLLTKEAKHIHDSTYQVNLVEEFEFRNILHATSSLWTFERQKGNQGALKKSNICRVLEGNNISDNDSEVLEKYNNRGVNEIQFLSHSYFGENSNVLHFQHQSFAEILLAEYYLKIFIKYALDDDSNIDEARARLSLGEPTEQTVLFIKEMLTLLKHSSTDSISQDVIEKRKLLFPLMASLAITKHNKLRCNDIYYSWYSKMDIGDNQTEYPLESLKDWCIDGKKIQLILNFASKIINASKTYITLQTDQETALFNKEVTSFGSHNINNTPLHIDKWLALLIGNTLYNDTSDPKNIKLFNTDFNISYKVLFNLNKSWNYTFNNAAPSWGLSLFQGINMTQNENRYLLEICNFDSIDFSYSTLKNLKSWGGNWSRTRFHNCSFEDVEFITCIMYDATFSNLKKDNELSILNTTIGESCRLRLQLSQNNPSDLFNKKIYIITIKDENTGIVFDTLSGFIVYYLKYTDITLSELKTLFKFESNEAEKSFMQKLDTLKKVMK